MLLYRRVNNKIIIGFTPLPPTCRLEFICFSRTVLELVGREKPTDREARLLVKTLPVTSFEVQFSQMEMHERASQAFAVYSKSTLPRKQRD